MADFITNYWSGALTSNTTWTSANSPYYIGGDITVESGVTLTLSSGVQVIFLEGDDQSGGASSSKCELIVNGTLDAQGTSANPVEFTCNTGYWYGIRFVNADNNSELSYCEISKADYGVYVESCSPEISYCYIHDNTNGINIYNSGSPLLLNNTISDNGTGVQCFYYGEPDFVQTGTSGLNLIKDNTGDNGIILGVYSDGRLGDAAQAGYNTVKNSTPYDVLLLHWSSADARSCYWGAYPPNASQFSVGSGCSLDRSSPLSSQPPGSGSPLSKSAAGQQYVDEFDPKHIDPDDPKSLWQYARYVRYHDQDPDQALDINQQIIKRFPSSVYARKALCQVFHISDKHNIPGMSSWFKTLRSKNLPLETRAVVHDLSVIRAIKDRDYKAAESLCRKALQDLTGSGYEPFTLYQLTQLYRCFLPDAQKADRYLNQLTQRYPEHRLTALARGDGEAYATNPELSKPVAQTITEASLHPAHPNPFNPATTISYQLPEAAHVTLKVYDLRGREIATLVDAEKDAGFREIRWNGRDALGQSAASGVYFYHLRTSSGYTKSCKMVLIK
ncbi:MAG: right-handed parallel beta-helix repeat-containing protein [candidate division KSB1 bacterium]|nr:right-handed parallel beta-helix repeat-containing protein [candidate division KSB1 bacterium]